MPPVCRHSLMVKLTGPSDVKYSEMFTGVWSIIIEAHDIGYWMKRDVDLVVTERPRVTVTVRKLDCHG
jgi:hypothetical protein